MTRARVLLSRLLDLLFAARRERRLEEEIRTHLDLLTDEYIAAGLPPAAARQAARRAFGGVDQMKERYRDQRGLPWLDVLSQDVRFAFRLMRRHPGFTTTAILILGLGIGVNNMLFTMLNAHTLRGLPMPRADRVLFLSTVDDRGGNRGLSFGDYRYVAGAARHIHTLAAYRPTPMVVAGDDRAAERFDGVFTTATAFDLASVRPSAGRTFTTGDEQAGAANVVLLSESVWRTRYAGDRGLLGRTLVVDGTPATVVGIVPDRSGLPTTGVVWRPLAQLPGLEREPRSARTLQVLGRLADGSGLGEAAAEVAGIGARIAAEHPDSTAATRLHAVPVNDRFLGNATDTVWIAFMATGFIVLLISAANVANLMVDRSLLRARELAIRASVGGSGGRLARQLLVEGVVLAGAGAAVGLFAAMAGVRGFHRMMPAGALPYWLDYSVDWRVLAALIGVAALTVLVFALVPAIQASRTDVVTVLKDGRSGRPARRRVLATVFLSAQVALAVVLLSHFAVTLRTIAPSLQSDAIFEQTEIVSATIAVPAGSYPSPDERAAFYDRLLERVAGAPGIGAAALASAAPASGGDLRAVVAEGGRPADQHAERKALVLSITPGYFRTLGLELLLGRPLDRRDGGAGHANVVVNERFARTMFTDQDAIGRRIALAGTTGDDTAEWLTIVGVAPDIRQGRGEDAIVYRSFLPVAPVASALLVRSALDTAGTVAAMREQLRGVDSGLPLDRPRTLPALRFDLDWNGRLSSRLFLFLTLIAVLLATFGLYAVTAHAVTQERREIGVRMALGATPFVIARRVLRRLLIRASLGFGGGIVLTLLWDRSLGSGTRGVHATDPGPLAIVFALLLGFLIVAAIVPARRASRVDPLIALRAE